MIDLEVLLTLPLVLPQLLVGGSHEVLLHMLLVLLLLPLPLHILIHIVGEARLSSPLHVATIHIAF